MTATGKDPMGSSIPAPKQSNGHHAVEPVHEPAQKAPSKQEVHKEVPKEAHKEAHKEEHKGSADVHCSNKLKKPEDLTGFPVFPAGTKSLLSKHLTRELWAKYGEEKDSYGFSFKQAILSGC